MAPAERTPPKAAPPLGALPRIVLAVAAFAVAGALCAYWLSPPRITTMTTSRDAQKRLVSTTTAVQQQRGDGVVALLLGLATVMAITAITAGRLRFSVGGVSAEIVAVAAQTIGELQSRADPDDPQVKAALARWAGTLEKHDQ